MVKSGQGVNANMNAHLSILRSNFSENSTGINLVNAASNIILDETLVSYNNGGVQASAGGWFESATLFGEWRGLGCDRR